MLIFGLCLGLTSGFSLRLGALLGVMSNAWSRAKASFRFRVGVGAIFRVRVSISVRSRFWVSFSVSVWGSVRFRVTLGLS